MHQYLMMDVCMHGMSKVKLSIDGKGCILQELKNYSEAIAAYKNGLEGNPMDICCLKGITFVYFLMEDYSSAMHWAQTWLQLLGPSKVF